MTEVDYSDEAITRRIRQVSQLRNLCLSLATARPVEPKTAGEPANDPPSPPKAGSPR